MLKVNKLLSLYIQYVAVVTVNYKYYLPVKFFTCRVPFVSMNWVNNFTSSETMVKCRAGIEPGPVVEEARELTIKPSRTLD